MKTFLIIYSPGPAWLAGKPTPEQPLQAHGKHILEMYRAGKLRFAGPFEDDSGGAVVIEVEDRQAAQSFADDDPAVIDRILTYDIRPWRLLPWDHYANAVKQ